MRSSIREGFWQIRTAVVGLFLIAIVVLAVLALRGTNDGAPVVLTGSAVSYGQPLAESAPRIAIVSSQFVPDGALTDPDEIGASAAAGHIPAGSILTTSDLGGSPNARKLADGQMMIGFPLSIWAATGFTVGDSVDIWGQDGQCSELTCPPKLLAEQVEILRISESAGASWGTEETVVFSVSAPKETIGTLLAAASNDSLSLALRPVVDP